jgi:hypothetical protein
MVVTTSPACSRYRMVVLPAPSRPRIRIRISLVGHSQEGRAGRLPGPKETLEIAEEASHSHV